MEGLELIEPTELYNILNQSTEYPCVSDQNYLLLLDARSKCEFNESHVITSKKSPEDDEGNFIVPYNAELECKEHVIVYDGNTQSVEEPSRAVRSASIMFNNGSKNNVKILRGGYEEFSALYPFLRTQETIYMPQELEDFKTYPIEIIPGLLYLGNKRQGSAPYIFKDVKIKCAINCTMNEAEDVAPENPDVIDVPVTDCAEADISKYFEKACRVIDNYKNRDQVVLVYSDLGISRSVAIILAYLIHTYNYPLDAAYKHVQQCGMTVRPNRGFIQQLSKWEETKFGECVTDISDPRL
ncbi:serine/threonine/tyrosine-interacting-like protein 1 [Tubulanus polymorphus]|uniref:serine/threonine/tyrosine-interacting-like protein 1 n=1 Tax=Tubulanus polymorphus TaxID=672921 RepID=UPI003DA6A748